VAIVMPVARRRLVALAVAVGVLVLGAAVALARPGGGDSYSGGGGHGDGGGGDGTGAIIELLFHLLRLCIYYPSIGLPILAVVIIGLLWAWRRRVKNRDWDSGPPVQLEKAIDAAALRRVDPDFSQVTFEDFVFRLFSAAQRARDSERELAKVAPYVNEDARAELAGRAPGEKVGGVVVGALRLVHIELPASHDDHATDHADEAGSGTTVREAAHVRIRVELEANVQTAKATYFSVENWTFARDKAARTKAPDPARVFKCPNCGAPWEAKNTLTQQCSYCSEIVDNGRFDWIVEEIEVASIDARPPTLTEEVPERGGDVPTYTQPGFDRLWVGLVQDDPALSDTDVLARLHHIYAQLNAQWAANDLGPARGLISDGLYDSLMFWIEAYRAQGLRNALVDMRITHTAMCKLVRDRWYDALTIRIWGRGKDYVVRVGDGDVVRGSTWRDRKYSEYWTLVRSASRRGPARADDACPNCGAPRVVNAAGACDHCGVHLTAGEFDWVLSKIEQDDSYRG
jgi:hypothetical protein